MEHTELEQKLIKALEGIELIGKHSTAGHDRDCKCATCLLRAMAHVALMPEVK